MKPSDAADPELQLQRAENLDGASRFTLGLCALVIVLIVLFQWVCNRPRAVRHWLKWQTVCAWCQPHRRLRGNPFSRLCTHGICRACFSKHQPPTQPSK